MGGAVHQNTRKLIGVIHIRLPTLYKPCAGFDNQCLKHDDVHVSVTDRRTHDYTVHYSALAEDLPVRVSQLNSITLCPYRMDELCI